MNKYTYVRAIFPSDDGDHSEKKQYLFKSYLRILCPGDYVVCDTRYGFAVAQISEVDVPDKEVKKFNPRICGNLREIVGIVNTDDFFRRKADREKMKSLKKKMEERMKKLQENAVYELMAKSDEEMASLLKEYKDLAEEE